tara:strand:- start:668 stop:1312 length:645 start_codon:yes stop_codon:yes gene_type:complete
MSQLKLTADSGGGTVAIKGPASTTGNGAIELTIPGTGNATLATTSDSFGKILQVVNTNITTTSSATIPNASLVDTPATVNITSLGANSKFIIAGCVSGEATISDHVLGIVLRRVIGGSGTSINVGDVSGSKMSITSIHQQGLHSADNQSTPSTNNMSAYVDAPNQAAGTTITYKYTLIGHGYTGTYYFGRTVNDIDNSSYERLPQHITVMEVAA